MANRARTLKIPQTIPSEGRLEGSVGRARARSAPRLVRIERPRLGEERIAEREVRELPAQLLPGLPVAATLFVQVPGHAGPVAIATSPERAETERAAGRTVFDPAEWSAIVTAAESDRMWPSDLREVCARKVVAREAGGREWALDLDGALAGARADAPQAWSVGRVLDRIGATIVGLEC